MRIPAAKTDAAMPPPAEAAPSEMPARAAPPVPSERPVRAAPPVPAAVLAPSTRLQRAPSPARASAAAAAWKEVSSVIRARDEWDTGRPSMRIK